MVLDLPIGKDSEIGEAVNVLDHSIILKQNRRQNNVGPFAHIRPGCLLETETKAGSFVELKNSTVGKGQRYRT